MLTRASLSLGVRILHLWDRMPVPTLRAAAKVKRAHARAVSAEAPTPRCGVCCSRACIPGAFTFNKVLTNVNETFVNTV